MVLIFAVLLGIGGYILKETQFGLFLYAVGNNDEAARRAGVKVPRIKMAAFAIAGGIAALAGVIAASRTLGVGVFSGGGVGGGTLLLESIAAAVIGGVSLFGGRGAIHAALLGALVIGTVQNGLNLMGVENEVRLIVTGLLLVLAVSIDKLIERPPASSLSEVVRRDPVWAKMLIAMSGEHFCVCHVCDQSGDTR